MTLNGIWALAIIAAMAFLVAVLAYLILARLFMARERYAALPGFFTTAWLVVVAAVIVPILGGVLAAVPLGISQGASNPVAVLMVALGYGGLLLHTGFLVGLLGAALIIALRLSAGRVTLTATLAIAVACVWFSFGAHGFLRESDWLMTFVVAVAAISLAAACIYAARNAIGLASIFGPARRT